VGLAPTLFFKIMNPSLDNLALKFKTSALITGVATGPGGTIGDSKLDILKGEKP
jgi:hypothetical protein